MIYTKKPKQFHPQFDVVSCFVLCKEKILLLHRAEHKPEGGTWGTVAGKVDPEDASFLDAIIREMHEETGIARKKGDVLYHTMFYVRYPYRDFTYHIFSTEFRLLPQVILRPHEHSEYMWVSPKEAVTMNLIPDMKEVIENFFHIA